MIYIDSDDVAADWVKYVTRTYFNGVTREEFNKLPELAVSLEKMYMVDRHLFYKLSPLRGFSELFSCIKDVADYRILTVGAMGLHPDNSVVESDKRNWWRDWYSVPADKVNIVYDSHCKSTYAKSIEDILIDDRLDTVKQFVKAGGRGIYLPYVGLHTPERINDFRIALAKLRNLDDKSLGYITVY